MPRRDYHFDILPDESRDLCTFLAESTNISKTKIKKALRCGAVWLERHGKNKRCRRATYTLKSHEKVALFYDESLLEMIAPSPQLVEDFQTYSVWIKPAGLLSQGTKCGDHCSLLRQVELYFQQQRQVFLVHRLDREAGGLILVAHNAKTAARLSELFQQRKIIKRYRVRVTGDLRTYPDKTINLQLDDKKALTTLEQLTYDPATTTSLAEVTIATGRKHQIRRHFDYIGHPVCGDPLYGSNNSHPGGLQLWAVELAFLCPETNRHVHLTYEPKP